jgi:hypothetical protein
MMCAEALSYGLLKGEQDFTVHGMFPIMGGAIRSVGLRFLFFPPFLVLFLPLLLYCHLLLIDFPSPSYFFF